MVWSVRVVKLQNGESIAVMCSEGYYKSLQTGTVSAMVITNERKR